LGVGHLPVTLKGEKMTKAIRVENAVGKNITKNSAAFESAEMTGYSMREK
jgi:hypothetical protein